MNLELSLPLIWLVLFTLLSLPSLPRTLKSLKPRPLLLCFLFPLYLTCSTLWSPNPLRALLTAGIFWCLIITILTIPKIIIKKNIKTKLVKITIITSVIIALFCWLQCLLDILNLPRDLTLLCRGCTYRSFGFPHPSGFAIEPQFMGNLLLAPSFLALLLLLNPKEPHPTPQTFSDRFIYSKKYLLPITIFLIATLFLTFSRGAIYAFLLGLAALLVIRLIKSKQSQILLALPITLLAFLISLFAQGTLAQLSPTTDTFASGISKAISQLTLGHLTLPANSTPPQPASETPTDHSAKPPTDTTNATNQATTPTSHFNGYVTESTEVRVSLTNSALSAWQDYRLFGSGLASSGTVLHAHGFTSTPKEIVQNEYATLLLELGLVGCLLLLVSLVLLAIVVLPPLPPRPRAYLLALILSFAATLFFFSGLPNALHLYLFPVLFLAFAQKPSFMV